jgi:hypothetical protein
MFPCFLGGFESRLLQHVESRDESRPALARIDHVVDVSACRRNVGVRELVAILGDARLGRRLGIVRRPDLLAKEHLDGALRAHHGDLGLWPREVHVAPDVLRVHDVVGAAVRLSGDQRHLGDGRLGERVQELRPVPDDAAVLLCDPGQEARHVLEDDERDVERVAEAHEARTLVRGVDVQHSREHRRLIGDDPDRVSPEVSEPDDDVAGEPSMHLVEVPIVHDVSDHVVHVVGMIRVVRNDRSSSRPGGRARRCSPPQVVGRGCSAGCSGRAPAPRRGSRARSHTRNGPPRTWRRARRRRRALHVDVLVRDRLHHVGSGHEHVARAADHVDEVGDRG